jgi:squalene/oxidosqualene cyclase-like protein
MNPIPPELFLAPKWLPLRTDDLYCHTRHIYRAMAYLYGCRFRADLGNILADLRRELYTEPYEQIRFSDYRHALADSDVYVRPGRTLRFFFNVLSATEHLAPTTIRRRALERCASGVLYQQRQTEYQALSPVDGMLNTLVLFERKDPEFARSLAGLEKWRWESEDEGIRYAGARSISWDTAFAMRATLEFAPAVAEQRESLRRAYRFLCGAQLTEEIEGTAENGRDPVLGGWCFSDGKHRWPVSDCTAEAISALLAAHDWDALIPHEEQISQERLRWAAYFLLSRQNAGGGFGTYERRRGSRLLEWINPSEMFGQCMTELSYIECTSSCVQALLRFRAADPQWHAAEIDRAIAAGCRFLRAQQRPDGSFAGFWGINFTYAAFFVTEALLAAGAPADDAVLYKAAHWLLARQLPDGGWGEHWRSCLDGAYRPHERSQVVMTSWALLALLPLVGAGSEAVQKAVEWLAARQKPDGSWPSEAVNGVFFGAAMLDYRYYRVYFPAWALARYARLREAAFRN